VGARVLVTGAQGFLGRHVSAALLDAGADAVLGLGRSARVDERFTHDLDWLGVRRPAPLPGALRAAAADSRYAYRPLDLRDADALAETARAFRPDVVIHTAAALRDSAWEELVASNVDATRSLVRGVAAAADEPRLVLTSSVSVYGAARGVVPFAEDGPIEPIDLYGATKRTGEDVARIVARDTGVRLVVARVFNLFGPGLQDIHLPASLAARVGAIARGLAPRELELGPLEVTRDFVDVRDAAAALVLLAEAPDPPPVVNVGTGVETPVRSVLDVVLELAEATDVRVHWVEGRRADVPRSVADVGRLASLGFAPRHDLRGTLEEMLAYMGVFPIG
jgi:GDP-4-dehydro-6-deoxy-D-mannose reductase